MDFRMITINYGNPEEIFVCVLPDALKRFSDLVRFTVSHKILGYEKYSPMFNCRIYTLIRFSGPEVVIFAYSYISAYWHLALRPSRTRLKNWHANSFFHCFTMFFLRKGRRAQRAENFEAISYTLKKIYSLIRISPKILDFVKKTFFSPIKFPVSAKIFA